MIKKLKLILLILLISVVPKFQPAFSATQGAYAEYNLYDFDYKPGMEYKFEANANKYLKLYDRTLSETNKNYYIDQALKNAFMLSKIAPDYPEAHVIIARCYDAKGKDTSAKEHFYLAYNLDSKNANVNFYFGNFYYKRNELINALEYYQNAYKYGYSSSFFLNKRLGNLYEKLGDLQTAKKYYQKALKLNNHASIIRVKINSIDELNYSQSQYYLK